MSTPTSVAAGFTAARYDDAPNHTHVALPRLEPSLMPRTPIRPLLHDGNAVHAPPGAPRRPTISRDLPNNPFLDAPHPAMFAIPAPLPEPAIPPRPVRCPGVRVQWTAGSVGLTYPFRQHDVRTLSFAPSGYVRDHLGEWLFLRSSRCLEYITPVMGAAEQPPCRACATTITPAVFGIGWVFGIDFLRA